MKRFLLLFTLTAVAYGCSNDDNNPTVDETKLIGVWFLENAMLNGDEVVSSNEVSPADEILFMNEERVYFTYLSFGAGGEDYTQTADYIVEGNSLMVTWQETEFGNGSTDFEIMELTTEKLKIKRLIPGEGTIVETYLK